MAEGNNQTPADGGGDKSGGKPRVEISIPKRGPGRPLGAKTGSGGGNSEKRKTPPDVENRGGDNPNSYQAKQAAFIGKGFVALVELAETFVHNSGAAKIEKKSPGRLPQFKEMAAQLALSEGDKNLLTECVTHIAAKHNWLTKYGPEVVLAVTLGQYGLRQAALMRFVDNVTKGEETPLPANTVQKVEPIKPATPA